MEPNDSNSQIQACARTPKALTISQWAGDRGFASEASWQTLLVASEADPLFMSWQWHCNWWRCFAQPLRADLCFYAGYSDAQLVGIAPLYLTTTWRRGVLVRSLQLIGNSWHESQVAFSEYGDVLALPGYADEFRRRVLETIRVAHRPTEIVIGNTRSGAGWLRALNDVSVNRGYMRQVDGMISYQADLSAGMPAYLRSLGASTRRALWHKRRRLASLGKIRLESVAARDIPSAFADLNRLHRLRWGAPAFAGNALAFHEAFAQSVANNSELAMSRLWVGDLLGSVLYDVVKSTTQYNLKLGFDPGFAPGVSLGLLHFGYALEHAAERDVQRYDFLGGNGKLSEYKSHLSQLRQQLVTLQVLPGRRLAGLYRAYDWWRGRFRS